MKKNIVCYVTRQYMRLNKKRTFTTFVGIIFMVLLMTCVFVGKDTAIGYLEDVASQKDGKWHVAMYDVTPKELEEVEELEEIEETAISVDYGFTEFAQSANENRPYLNVKAYTMEGFDWMNIKLKEGRLPESANEIVVSEGAMKDGAALAIGDTVQTEYFVRSITGIDKNGESFFPFFDISLAYGQTVAAPQNFPYYGENASFKEVRDYTGKKQELKVVGIMEVPGFEQESAAGYTAIAMLEEKEIAELESFNLSMKLDLKNLSLTYGTELREIAGEHEIDFNDYVLSFSGKSANSTINIMVTFLAAFFVILIIFASSFLIYNVFNMSFEERSRYLGMLSSVGATGRQKRSSIYYEAFYLLVFALPVGILAGVGIVKLGMLAIQPFLGKLMNLEQYVKDSKVALSVSWEAVAVIVVLCIVTVLISSYLPARKIGKVGSIECIRGNADKKNKQYPINLSVIHTMGAEGMLAGNALRRQGKKTRAITAATAVFIVIMFVTAFGTSAIEKAVEAKIGNSDDLKMNYDNWDYLFVSNGAKNEEYEIVKQEIEQAEGIAETAEWYSGMFVGSVPTDCFSREYWNDVHDIYNLYYHRELSDEEFDKMTEDMYPQVNILAVDSKTLAEMTEITGTDLEKLEDTDVPGAIVVQEGVMSTENTGFVDMEPEKYRFYDVKQMTDKKIGESLPVEIYSEEKGGVVDFPIQVAGYATSEQLKEYVSFHSQYLWLIVSIDTVKQINQIMGEEDGTPRITPEFYIRTESENPKILEKLRTLSDMEDSKYFLMATDYSATIQEAIIGIVHILLSCFVFLTSIICLLNLFNSIRSRVNDRSREFAIMESVGMAKAQIEKMLFYESVGIVLKSILYAGLIAFPLIYLIQYGLTEIFGPMTLKLPWLLAATAVLVAGLAVIFLTKYCYQKEKQENIMESIRNESV